MSLQQKETCPQLGNCQDQVGTHKDDDKKLAAAVIVKAEPISPKKKRNIYVPMSPLYPIGTHRQMMDLIHQRLPASHDKIMKKHEEDRERRKSTFKYKELEDQIELFIDEFLDEALRESSYYRQSYLGWLREIQDEADGELLEELLAEQVELDHKFAHILHQKELDKIVQYNCHSMRKESK